MEKSKLIKILTQGHKKVKLSREELDKIRAWINLAVPFCGDYYEAAAWNEKDKKYYNYLSEM